MNRFILIMIVSFILLGHNEIQAQKRKGKAKTESFFNRVFPKKSKRPSFKNVTKRANNKRKNDNQNSTAKRNFKPSRVGVYTDGMKVMGLGFGKSSDRFNVTGTFEYYLSYKFHASVTTGYQNISYNSSNRHLIPLFLEGNYTAYNINNTVYFNGSAGLSYSRHSVSGIEPSGVINKDLFGAVVGTEIILNVLYNVGIYGEIKQNFVFNSDHSNTINWSVGIKKTF